MSGGAKSAAFSDPSLGQACRQRMMSELRVWLYVLDVGLFALIAYYVYINIRNTQAIQLIKGILLLFALNLFAQYLGLWIVGRVLDSVITALIIAIPVIFQPELRRALWRLGRNPRLFEPAGSSISEVASVVAEASGHLESLGWGALIALEVETGLEQYISTGVTLNAKCTTHLIETLFMPGSPLHDGAIVIEDGKIAAAGCFLPLSQNIADRDLGSRHRAALGLSEVSDAVVVVVSEERRSISIAIDGTLYGPLRPEEVRSMIVARFSRQRDAGDEGFVARTAKKLLQWLRIES